MNIHQMQLSYSTQEDRIILRINSKENEEIKTSLNNRVLEERLIFQQIIILDH
jgi:hypothetical protein